MEKQYCRVGTTKPMTKGDQAVALLEDLYHSFKEKAEHIKPSNTRLGEFFELKAVKIKSMLDGTV